MTKDVNTLNFIEEFYKKVESHNINWTIKGLIGHDSKVYALGNDSKLIGRIFEIISAPLIEEIAKEHGLIVQTPEKQNTYPDFTLMRDTNDTEKIAIDIKTTYKEGNTQLVFTLGSFTSYLRNNTKNIEFPYDTYKEHYIIGFVYQRNTDANEGQIIDIKDIDNLNPPYINVEYFVQKKVNITGQTKGSGNTDNIGSIKGKTVDYFKAGNGPFSVLPPIVYEHYWQNFPKNTEKPKHYTDLQSYFSWLEILLDDELRSPEADSEKSREKQSLYTTLLSHKNTFEKWNNSKSN